MITEGYVLLWKKIKETSFYKDSYAVHLALHLLISANYTDTNIVFNNRPLVIKRGQILTGRHSLSAATGIRPATVRNKLNTLRQTGFLTSKSTNKFSIITICKYDDFQDIKKYKGQQVGQPEDSKRTAKGQPEDTPNKDNKDNKDNEFKDKDKDKDKEAIKPLRAKRAPKVSDEDFLIALKSNNAYQGIDIDIELARMDMWLMTDKGHGRKKTRGFILNWLSRAEKPLSQGASGGTSRHTGLDKKDYHAGLDDFYPYGKDVL